MYFFLWQQLNVILHIIASSEIYVSCIHLIPDHNVLIMEINEYVKKEPMYNNNNIAQLCYF